MWGALSDEGTGLSFTIAACPRQRSHNLIYRLWTLTTILLDGHYCLFFRLGSTELRHDLLRLVLTRRWKTDCLHLVPELTELVLAGCAGRQACATEVLLRSARGSVACRCSLGRSLRLPWRACCPDSWRDVVPLRPPTCSHSMLVSMLCCPFPGTPCAGDSPHTTYNEEAACS
jgi:hypothetical protein